MIQQDKFNILLIIGSAIMTNLDKVTRRDINSSNIRFPIKDAYSAAFPRFTADDIV